MMDERLKNSRDTLALQGFVEQADGTWTGKGWSATITSDPTLDSQWTTKPAYQILYKLRLVPDL